MTSLPKQKPELGKLYERKLVAVKRRLNDMVEEHYAIIRETKCPWRSVSEHTMGGDPLFLWDITSKEDDFNALEYHFLWRGKEKVYASLDVEDDFFRWFRPWEHR